MHKQGQDAKDSDVGACKTEASLSPSERGKNAGIKLKPLEKLKYIKPHRHEVEVEILLSHTDMKQKCKS